MKKDIFRGKPQNQNDQQERKIDTDDISSPIQNLYKKYQTTEKGLSSQESRNRLKQFGYNEPAKKQKRKIITQFLLKFTNPLVIVLFIIAVFSLFFGEQISAILVIIMALISVFLSFFQEYRAGKEAEKLMEMVHTTATVYRNGKTHEIKIREIVPGDIVELYAGDMIPADLRVISSKDLFINQSSLTGESFPVEKYPEPIQPKSDNLTDLTNIAFMGSSVVSGTGQGLVLRVGLQTQFGEISQKLAEIRTDTSFDKGIRSFTWLMIRFMLILVAVIFFINAIFKGNLVQALLFSLAVAVGLTPEMLPMIVTINLSKGAITMAKKQVIVKRLNSIQNFGAMDILCTDKTGTLTLDRIILEKYLNVDGQEDHDVLKFAFINSFYQTGLKNLLDRAVLKYEKLVVTQYKKIDEIPFDFSRKIMSVIVEMETHHRLITKGAPEEIFKRCTHCEIDKKIVTINDQILKKLNDEYNRLSLDGFRVLAVAYKDDNTKKMIYSKDDEKELILKGYIAFLDPPKPSVQKTILILKKLGIELKVLTGDNEFVTKKICGEVGLNIGTIYSGDMIEKLSDEQLKKIVETTTVFVRLSPLQKERVITMLRQNNHIVGYLGDGINDAPALKAADVGISVNNAVDIAKDSADLILEQKSLLVLGDGVIEGRKTFGNIVKYVKMGSSSNFGNMISMTGASIILPFLPMAPLQILLNNFLYDLSQTAIPTDTVDQDYLEKPRQWNIKSIQRFMIFIGPVSSIFDFLTFGVLFFLFQANQQNQSLFHTGWFIESLLTQTFVIYIIRTGNIPFLRSKPSKFLILASILIGTAGILIPISPIGSLFGFVTPPPLFFVSLILIIVAYLILVQIVKTWLNKKFKFE